MESWAELRTISRQARSSKPVRVLPRALEQRRQGLGPPLEFALGEGALPLHVDPVGGDAHEHVGPEARAQLSLARASRPVRGPARQVARAAR